MSVNGKFKNITADDVREVASRFGVGEVNQIIDEVNKAMKLWPKFAKKAGLENNEIERIAKLLIKKLP